MLSFITAIAGIAIVMAIWYGVQALARRSSHCSLDQDMLEGHGCGACDHSGACRKREGQHHGNL